MKRRELRHDCPTGDVITELPASVLSASMPWRCPECGQRWWCEIRAGGSANFTTRGRPSRAWRRAHKEIIR